MAAYMMLRALRLEILRFESKCLSIFGLPPPTWISPALAGLAGESSDPPKHKLLDINELMKDITLWAVPRNRRSLEKRQTRKNGWQRIMKWATPRKDLVSCLTCGHWHEAKTICGNCYSKVKSETMTVQESMNIDDRLYNIPRKEVVYMYKGEDNTMFGQEADKYFVEVEKERPEWWPRKMLTKGHGE